jgi:hypothetical protein
MTDNILSVRQKMSIESFKATQRAVQQQHGESQQHAEHDRALATVFQQPSDVLKARCKSFTDDGSDIMTNAIRQQDAFSAFRLALDEGGIELLPSGVQKVWTVGLVNKGVVELRDADTWMKVYEYLCELPGALTRTDVIVTQQPAESAPQSEPTPKIDERQALEEQMVDEYYGPRLQGFLDHLKFVWNVTLDTEQILQIQRWFERNDVPLTGENFGKLRREVLGLYSQQEQAEIELENVRTLDSPSAKAAYLRRLRAFD